jgi:hypothetical protein
MSRMRTVGRRRFHPNGFRFPDDDELTLHIHPNQSTRVRQPYRRWHPSTLNEPKSSSSSLSRDSRTADSSSPPPPPSFPFLVSTRAPSFSNHSSHRLVQDKKNALNKKVTFLPLIPCLPRPLPLRSRPSSLTQSVDPFSLSPPFPNPRMCGHM